MTKIFARVGVWGLLLTWVFFTGHSAMARRDVVAVDFSLPAGPPLVRKFGVSTEYEPGRTHSLLRWMAPMGLSSIRVEMNLGREDRRRTSPMVHGEPGALGYNWDALREQAELMNTRQVVPYWTYCYMPIALSEDGTWRSPAVNSEDWGESARSFAAEISRDDFVNRGYEVFNRPDDPAFFGGNIDDYLALYRSCVAGLRASHPDAVVGGPSLASDRQWVGAFLGEVRQDGLPLDFFSYHAVDLPGGESQFEAARNQLQYIRQALENAGEFSTTEIHLNSYSPVRPLEAVPGGVTDRHIMASRIMADMRRFLEEPDLTLIHLHTALDPTTPGLSYGLLDAAGNPKPAMAALAIYADMPVDRCHVVDGRVVRAMAAISRDRAGAVAWNPSDSDQLTEIRLMRFPFTESTLNIYRVDRLSEGADVPFLRRSDQQRISGQNALAWTGVIPAGGMVYLRIQPDERQPRTAGIESRIVRNHYFFADRGSRAYAHFDSAQHTARLGMGGERTGLAVIGVVVDQTPDELHLAVDRRGTWHNNPERLGAVRVDYHSADGYTHSVMHVFEGETGSETFDPPWGTRSAPRQRIYTGNATRHRLDLAESAPEDWDGRTLFTFILRSSGPDSHAVIRMER